jgi:thiamine-phosphate pyrophosphorylase
MIPETTPAVSRALAAAQEHARRSGASDVRPVHLLLGLLSDEEGRAAVLLSGAGANPAAVRADLLASLPVGPAQPLETPLPLQPAVQESLQRARAQALALSAEHAVSSDHLLGALLEIDIPLRQSLEVLGLSWPRLQAQLARSADPPLRPDEPLQLPEPTDRLDTARILDANGNRAREALRVVEDYCRYVLDDAFLCGALKRLRHGLVDTLGLLADKARLAARETLQDVGTAIAAPGEYERHGPAAVARANFARLQEALRALEEYGKIVSPDLGRSFEQLRYQCYTLERAILLGADARRRLADARLYVLLTGAQCRAALDWTIQEAAAGGATMFQLREKNLSDRQLLERARQVRGWTRDVGALFIMNDRPDIARLAEADGVHLGQDELPVRAARRIMGAEALIGVSTHNMAQVQQAVLDGASYIGVGPTFPSGTKEFAEFPGLDFVRAATAETSLPAFVIGGVNESNIGAAVAAGAKRVAVSQAVCQAEEPQMAAKSLRRQLPGERAIEPQN